MNISNVAANCDGKIKRVEPEIVSLQTTGSSLRALLRVYKPMEGSVKARLLLTSALFMFVQIPSQAQQTLDVAKITCKQYFFDEITFSQYVVMWLSGYYNGKRNNTIIDPDALKKDEEKINQYCQGHRDTTVMDAVKNVLGFDK